MAESGAKKLSGLDSLKLELVVTAMALVLAMSASMGLTVAWIHGRAAGETRLKAAAAFARGAALSLSDHADWGGYPWPDMESAAQAAGLELTLAAGANGRLVFRRSGGATEGEAALRAALFGDWPVVSADSGRLAVAAPVFRNGLVVGAVCFTGRQADGWAAVDVAGLWMIGALGLNIGLMGLYLVFFLNRRLLGPLKELARDLAAL
ncbi:MAG: hypothetical protein LBV21_02205, partial [Candidatus Adiutrix sp.]|nr:hypothetical protein [Candidatus Adiutrix sp.]